MKIHTGRFYNEISGMRINDIFSLFILDFPIFVVRKYMDCHGKNSNASWHIGLLGITFGFWGKNVNLQI